MAKKCTILLVNWNAGDSLLRFFSSLKEYEDVTQFQLIVSDNGSVDGSINALRQQFPEVEVIENNANLGFGAGNNRAMSAIIGEYLLIANPDIEFTEQGLNKLMAELDEDATIGAISGKIYNSDGSFMHQCRRSFPRPLTSLLYALHLPSGYLLDGSPVDKQQDVEVLSGSFFMTRSALFKKMQGFDEAYFLFAEEVDLFRRMKDEWFRICYLPDYSAIHHGGVCFDSVKGRSLFYHFHMTRSHIILWAKERIEGRLGGMASTLAFAATIFRYLLLSVVKFNFSFFSQLAEMLKLHSGEFAPYSGTTPDGGADKKPRQKDS